MNIQMEAFPLISFIMPVYNDGESVEKAVESIFDQDWPAIEVIAVNDGSTDNTKSVLDKLKKKHPKLTVIHKENEGACVARNIGAKAAKGKYYAWLPADAKIYPGMVRFWVERLEQYPEYDGLYGGYRFVDDAGNVVSNYFSEEFFPYLLECANYIDGSFPIKAETFWRVAKLMNQPDGLWDPNIKSLQDWDFWLSVVKEGEGKLLYVRDIFFETTLPHAGGLSADSHKNWLARTNTIKRKHNIPDRKICVTAPGAPYFAKYIAKLLDADFKHVVPFKDHDYDLIYELGWYPSIAEQCHMAFVDPKYMDQYEQLSRERKEVPLSNAIKVVHLIGTDILQMQWANKFDKAVFQALLNLRYDNLFVEFKETLNEAKELGLNAEILALPPRKFYDAKPFPKKFTVAVYAPPQNQALYNLDLMVKVAKSLPQFDFKFFGDQSVVGKVDGNIEYVGYVLDMQQFIDSCSCLLRITTHDGLPQAVLEFLSAGRRVVFNHELLHVNKANKQLDVKAIASALKEESKLPLNEQAVAWVRKDFDREKFKKKIYSLLTYDPKKFWEKNAPAWIEKCHLYGTKDWDALEPWIKKLNPKSVVDVGCGTGVWSEKFTCEYTGIDISEKLIRHAKKTYPTRTFVTTSLEEADIPKHDLAFCYTVFEHIPEANMEAAVNALKKMCKKALLVEPIGIKTKNYCHAHNYHQWFRIEKEMDLGPRKAMLCSFR